MARKKKTGKAAAPKSRGKAQPRKSAKTKKAAGAKARPTSPKKPSARQRERGKPRPAAKAAKRSGGKVAAVRRTANKKALRKPKAAPRPASKKAILKKAAKPTPKPSPRLSERAGRDSGALAEGKISRAVKKLLALKAEKTKKVSRKEGYLIKAPKKTKQEERLGVVRFVRRLNSVVADVNVAKDNNPSNKPKRALRKKEIDDLRRVLNEERQRLINHLARLDEMASLSGPSEVNQDVPGYSIHLAEYASDNQIVETSLAQRALQAERLAEIEQALQRVSQPGYGLCQNCGAQINIERLKIKPFAVLCVRCRELKEQGRL